MNKLKIYLILIVVSLIVFIACNTTKVPPPPPPTFTNVDELVKWCGRFSDPIDDGKSKIGNTFAETGNTSGGVFMQSNSQKYKFSKSFNDFVDFGNQPKNVMYPGSIINGDGLGAGELSSIGETFSRRPIILTLHSGKSENVDVPNYSNVNEAVQKLVKNYTPTAANGFYKLEIYHSKEQAMMDVNVSANWKFVSGKFSSNTSNSIEEKTMMLYFKQVYYTVSINTQSFASDYFGDDVDLNKLSQRTSKRNPLCIISEVDYGRVIMVEITSKKSYDTMKQDIEAGLNLGFFGVGASGSYSPKNSKLSRGYSFKALIYGGNQDIAMKAMASNNINDIIAYIKDGAVYSSQNVGQPIACRVNYLYDNKSVKVGSKTEYTLRNWQKAFDKVKIRFDKIQMVTGAPKTNMELYYNFYVDVDGVQKDASVSLTRNEQAKIKNGGTHIINKITANSFSLADAAVVTIRCDMWDADAGVLGRSDKHLIKNNSFSGKGIFVASKYLSNNISTILGNPQTYRVTSSSYDHSFDITVTFIED